MHAQAMLLQLLSAEKGKCHNANLNDPIDYKAILIADKATISPTSQAKLDELSKAGVPILTDGNSVKRPLTIVEGKTKDIVHTHRIIIEKGKQKDLFYIANIIKTPTTIRLRFNDKSNVKKATLWNNLTGKKSSIKANNDGTFSLTLQPGESIGITI